MRAGPPIAGFRPSGADPGGGELRRVLASHVGYLRARARRQALVGLLAASSVWLWPLAAWPRLLPSALLRAALTGSLLLGIGLALAAVAEWRWYRRWSQEWTLRPGRGGRTLGCA